MTSNQTSKIGSRLNNSNLSFNPSADQLLSSNKMRAILVHIYFNPKEDLELLEEFESLAKAAGIIPVKLLTLHRKTPNVSYFVGSGKVAEIHDILQTTQSSLVLFNHDLAPRQERNLTQRLQCRILGRTSLVLDIFAQRARSFEGKLQVSLAQLQHLFSRLVRGWTHLERQQGGIGLRGPGETQLETDRRLLKKQIKHLQLKIHKLKNQRQQSSQKRKQSQIPLVTLVGYTNAGKSHLSNCLTGGNTLVADKLFATLDPLLRRLRLPNGQVIVLADTVGFIRHLPHDLIEAFSATLDAVREANLLLHVVDASSPNRLAQMEAVQNVLKQIGADHIPQICIYNKVDRLNNSAKSLGEPNNAIWLSATTGAGIDELKENLMKQLSSPTIVDFEHFT